MREALRQGCGKRGTCLAQGKKSSQTPASVGEEENHLNRRSFFSSPHRAEEETIPREPPKLALLTSGNPYHGEVFLLRPLSPRWCEIHPPLPSLPPQGFTKYRKKIYSAGSFAMQNFPRTFYVFSYNASLSQGNWGMRGSGRRGKETSAFEMVLSPFSPRRDV